MREHSRNRKHSLLTRRRRRRRRRRRNTQYNTTQHNTTEQTTTTQDNTKNNNKGHGDTTGIFVHATGNFTRKKEENGAPPTIHHIEASLTHFPLAILQFCNFAILQFCNSCSDRSSGGSDSIVRERVQIAADKWNYCRGNISTASRSNFSSGFLNCVILRFHRC